MRAGDAAGLLLTGSMRARYVVASNHGGLQQRCCNSVPERRLRSTNIQNHKSLGLGPRPDSDREQPRRLVVSGRGKDCRSIESVGTLAPASGKAKADVKGAAAVLGRMVTLGRCGNAGTRCEVAVGEHATLLGQPAWARHNLQGS